MNRCNWIKTTEAYVEISRGFTFTLRIMCNSSKRLSFWLIGRFVKKQRRPYVSGLAHFRPLCCAIRLNRALAWFPPTGYIVESFSSKVQLEFSLITVFLITRDQEVLLYPLEVSAKEISLVVAKAARRWFPVRLKSYKSHSRDCAFCERENRRKCRQQYSCRTRSWDEISLKNQPSVRRLTPLRRSRRPTWWIIELLLALRV